VTRGDDLTFPGGPPLSAMISNWFGWFVRRPGLDLDGLCLEHGHLANATRWRDRRARGRRKQAEVITGPEKLILHRRRSWLHSRKLSRLAAGSRPQLQQPC
jgi:hypothetical protein